jgi:hypothetical protein
MATTKAPTAKIIFDQGKIGRHGGVEPLEITDHTDEYAVMNQLLRFIARRRLLASRYPEVWIGPDGTGGIDAGFRTVATFKIEVQA